MQDFSILTPHPFFSLFCHNFSTNIFNILILPWHLSLSIQSLKTALPKVISASCPFAFQSRPRPAEWTKQCRNGAGFEADQEYRLMGGDRYKGMSSLSLNREKKQCWRETGWETAPETPKGKSAKPKGCSAFMGKLKQREAWGCLHEPVFLV